MASMAFARLRSLRPENARLRTERDAARAESAEKTRVMEVELGALRAASARAAMDREQLRVRAAAEAASAQDEIRRLGSELETAKRRRAESDELVRTAQAGWAEATSRANTSQAKVSELTRDLGDRDATVAARTVDVARLESEVADLRARLERSAEDRQAFARSRVREWRLSRPAYEAKAAYSRCFLRYGYYWCREHLESLRPGESFPDLTLDGAREAVPAPDWRRYEPDAAEPDVEFTAHARDWLLDLDDQWAPFDPTSDLSAEQLEALRAYELSLDFDLEDEEGGVPAGEGPALASGDLAAVPGEPAVAPEGDLASQEVLVPGEPVAIPDEQLVDFGDD